MGLRNAAARLDSPHGRLKNAGGDANRTPRFSPCWSSQDCANRSSPLKLTNRIKTGRILETVDDLRVFHNVIYGLECQGRDDTAFLGSGRTRTLILFRALLQ